MTVSMHFMMQFTWVLLLHELSISLLPLLLFFSATVTRAEIRAETREKERMERNEDGGEARWRLTYNQPYRRFNYELPPRFVTVPLPRGQGQRVESASVSEEILC